MQVPLLLRGSDFGALGVGGAFFLTFSGWMRLSALRGMLLGRASSACKRSCVARAKSYFPP